MSAELAQQVVIGVTVVGAIVWLWSLTFLMQSARSVKPVLEAEDNRSTPENSLSGVAEVDGDPKTLVARAASLLAKGQLGSLKIVEKTDDRLVFERTDPGISRQPAGRWFRRGEFHFTSLRQNRTQVSWNVEAANLRWLLWVGGIIQIVSLIALIVGCWAMMTFVATSPEPAKRWQSLQMLQVIHLLWPLFLFGGLYRKGSRGIAAEFESFANNLPFLGDQA
jgi:hypothetical protein